MCDFHDFTSKFRTRVITLNQIESYPVRSQILFELDTYQIVEAIEQGVHFAATRIVIATLSPGSASDRRDQGREQ